MTNTKIKTLHKTEADNTELNYDNATSETIKNHILQNRERDLKWMLPKQFNETQESILYYSISTYGFLMHGDKTTYKGLAERVKFNYSLENEINKSVYNILILADRLTRGE